MKGILSVKADLTKIMGVPVHVNIEEIRKPEIDAQLIADSISQQLEKRIMFRRAMKRAMQNAIRLGAKGIKIMSSGRLNGIEIARKEWYREGRVPLHTLRADVDYGTSEAQTTYGIIGVKVWVYKGDSLLNADVPALDVSADDDKKRRGARRDDARPTSTRPRSKKVDNQIVSPVSAPNAFNNAVKRVRVKKSDAASADGLVIGLPEKAGE
jgi:small subunit ribosomal protein S3